MVINFTDVFYMYGALKGLFTNTFKAVRGWTKHKAVPDYALCQNKERHRDEMRGTSTARRTGKEAPRKRRGAEAEAAEEEKKAMLNGIQAPGADQPLAFKQGIDLPAAGGVGMAKSSPRSHGQKRRRGQYL